MFQLLRILVFSTEVVKLKNTVWEGILYLSIYIFYLLVKGTELIILEVSDFMIGIFIKVLIVYLGNEEIKRFNFINYFYRNDQMGV